MEKNFEHEHWKHIAANVLNGGKRVCVNTYALNNTVVQLNKTETKVYIPMVKIGVTLALDTFKTEKLSDTLADVYREFLAQA